jgi:diguanylate cyclase (GGDEF)-like protein/PAS domain S-box-containing protein
MPVEEQAAMLHAFVSSSRDGLVATDLDGTVVWANPAAAAMVGLMPEELPGRALTMLVRDEHRDRVRDVHRRLLTGEHAGGAVSVRVERDGDVVEVSATPGVRRDAGGRVLGTTWILRDVASPAQTPRGPTDAHARSRARFDDSTLPQALLDLEGRVVAVNDAACDLLGRSRAALVGHAATELVRPADTEDLCRRLELLRAGSLRAVTHEAAGVGGDGETLPLLLDITAVRDADGTARELAVLATDLRDIRDVERRLARQAAFFRGLHREASDVMLVSDATGALRYLTPSVTRVLGYRPDQVRKMSAVSLLHTDDLAGLEERRRRLLEAPGSRERGTVRLRDAQGRWRSFDTTATNCLDDPDITGIVVHLREVTPEIEAEQALRDSEARYRAIAETAQEGILAVSPEGDTLFANERLAEILGLSMEEIYALGGAGIFPGAAVGQAGRQVGGRRPEARPDRIDVPYHHPDGGDRVLLVATSPLTGADGSVLGSVAMVSDVTEQRAAEAALRRQALHDALTGLPNRLLFLDRLTLAAARQKRADHGAVAVLFLDIDHFKRVNDTHGHEGGDRVLVEVASRLEQAVRATDTVARIGGDEFAVICEGAEATTAALVASRIHEALKEPVALGDVGLEVSMSIGVALSPPHRAEDLLRLADMAMYQAKATARGRVVMYDAGLPDHATRRLGVLRTLREALDAGSLPLGYEPVVDLRTAAVTGVRAAAVTGVRAVVGWNHPTLGPVDEQEVLRAADAGDLRHDLAVAVLRTAARRLGELRDRGVVDPRTSLRVPLGATSDPRLPVVAGQVLAEGRLPADLLRIELVASSARDDPGAAAELAAGLRDLGAGLVVTRLDARGDVLEHLTGLLESPAVAGLELDGGVVAKVTGLPDAAVAARRVHDLAHTAGVTAGADAVATQAQADLLREVGYDEARGPLWDLALSGEVAVERGGDT